MNTQRQVMYEERMKVLRGENIHQDILNLIPDYVADLIYDAIDEPNKPHTWDLGKINTTLENRALPRGTNFVTEDDLTKWDFNTLIKKCTEKTIACYEEKIAGLKEEGVDFSVIERDVLLQVVDKHWIDHIDSMDKLKRGIALRAYANEDPVNAFKKEGMEMFEEMTASIQEETVRFLLNVKVNVERRSREHEDPKQTNLKDLKENRGNLGQGGTVRTAKAPGRNDPCPCGSGKKYKNCCGRNV